MIIGVYFRYTLEKMAFKRMSKMEWWMKTINGDIDAAWERGEYPSFPSSLIYYMPSEKKTDTKSFFDIYLLCKKFDELLQVSKDHVVQILEPPSANLEKFELLIMDVKKIKYIAKSKAKDAVAACIKLPSLTLGNIVDQMTHFEPTFYEDDYVNFWKLEDNEAEIREELKKVYASLAAIYEILGKMCSCMSVNCQFCLAERFDWDDRDWRNFVMKYENAGRSNRPAKMDQ